MIYSANPKLSTPRKENRRSIMLEKGLECFRAIAEEANSRGVLLSDNDRLLVDLGFGGDVRSLSTSNPSTTISLYESKYFVPLVAHPSLNPIVEELFEEEIRRAKLMAGGIVNRSELVQIIRPWFQGNADFHDREEALGPVGCSALIVAKRPDGRYRALIGRRSSHCAVSVGAWTTSVDECISNLTGWERGLLWDAIGDELGIDRYGRDMYLNRMNRCGWMVPVPISEQDNSHPWENISQSGANIVFTLEISDVDLENLRLRFSEDTVNSGGSPEFDEFELIDLVDGIDFVLGRKEKMTEVLYSTLKFLEQNPL